MNFKTQPPGTGMPRAPNHRLHQALLLLVATLVVCAPVASSAAPSITVAPSASFTAEGLVRVEAVATGGESYTMRTGSCSTVVTSSPVVFTFTVEELMANCGYLQTDCTTSDTGPCVGFTGTYLYSGTLFFSSVYLLNTYQLLAGQLNVMVPGSISITTTRQTWIVATANTPINTPDTFNIVSTMQQASAADDQIFQVGSTVAFRINITTALPVAYEVTTITATYCAIGGGNECVDTPVVFWTLVATGPPTPTEIMMGGGAMQLEAYQAPQSFTVFARFDDLPSVCIDTSSFCAPGQLTMRVDVIPLASSGSMPARRRLLQTSAPQNDTAGSPVKPATVTMVNQVNIYIVQPTCTDCTHGSTSGSTTADAVIYASVTLVLIGLILFGLAPLLMHRESDDDDDRDRAGESEAARAKRLSFHKSTSKLQRTPGDER
jgi:hypothetical protein